MPGNAAASSGVAASTSEGVERSKTITAATERPRLRRSRCRERACPRSSELEDPRNFGARRPLAERLGEQKRASARSPIEVP